MCALRSLGNQEDDPGKNIYIRTSLPPKYLPFLTHLFIYPYLKFHHKYHHLNQGGETEKGKRSCLARFFTLVQLYIYIYINSSTYEIR